MSIAEHSKKIHPAAYGTIIYIFVTTGRIPELFPFLAPLMPGKIGILIGVLGLMYSFKKNKGSPSSTTTPIAILVLIFSLIAITSVSYSIYKTNSVNFFTSLFLSNIILFYLIIKSCTTTTTIKCYVYTLIISAALLALFTILNGGGEYGRASASRNYDANDLAKILIIVLPFPLLFAMSHKGKAKLCYFAITGLLVFALLLTGSRGGLLALAAALAYLFFSSIPNSAGKLTSYAWIKGSLVALVLLSSGFIIALLPTTTITHLSSIFTLDDDYNFESSEGRIAIWTRGLHALQSQPYGYGLAGFNAVEYRHGGRYMTAHNSLIQATVELGIQGGIVFILFYVLYWHMLSFLLSLLNNKKKPGKTLIIIGPGMVILLCAPLMGFLTAITAALLFMFTAIIFLNFDQKWKYDESKLSAEEKIYFTTISIALKASLIAQFISSFFLSAAYHPIFFTTLALVGGMFSFLVQKRGH